MPAVEQLAVVEGPLSGLGQDGEPGPIAQASAWMREHGVAPGMVATGGVVGALAASGLAGGAAKGALGAAAASWLYQRFSGTPRPLVGLGLAALVAYLVAR